MEVRTAVIWIQVISLLSLMQGIVAQELSSTAKPGCQNFCGNIEIPFPFGMESDCSAGEWFSIYCNHSTTPSTPILSKIQRTVTNIFLNGTISINFPLTSSCNSTIQSVNLSGSPFVFSQLHNKIIGWGCNNLVLMVNNTFRRNTTSTIGGCLSICENKRFNFGIYQCYGIGCCQTTIPVYLQMFKIILTTIQRNEEEGCKYGFVVNESWFNSNTSLFPNLKNLKFVPAVLEWSVPTNEISLLPRFSNSFDCHSILHSLSPFGIQDALKTCYCKPGYEGNPYLPNGCQDVDECKNQTRFHDPNFPGRTFICRNTIGSYELLPTEGRIDRTRDIGIGVGATFGALILLFGGWGLHREVKRRKIAKLKKKFFIRNGGLLLKQQLAGGESNVERIKLFDSKELENATDRFNANRILGKGGQGTVYKGMLVDGRIVAVKKSMRVDESMIGEFVNEIMILSQINQRNIVKLMGCCLETELPLLVYEFIPNGTLSNYLHRPNEDEPPLTWNMRVRIASEIAGALFYLHSAASQPIYHRDIKSSNILLDGKYQAKVADFGISRLVAIDQTHLTTQVQGTIGYLDPELFETGNFTEKSDVYSFGVVLVELLTGKKPISSERSGEQRSLAIYFTDSIEGNTLFDILDGRVINEGKREDIIVVANLAKRCLDRNGRARPTMKEVVMELDSVQMAQETLVVENTREVDESVMSEDTLPLEEDISMPTRSVSGLEIQEEVEFVTTKETLPLEEDISMPASSVSGLEISKAVEFVITEETLPPKVEISVFRFFEP